MSKHLVYRHCSNQFCGQRFRATIAIGRAYGGACSLECKSAVAARKQQLAEVVAAEASRKWPKQAPPYDPTIASHLGGIRKVDNMRGENYEERQK